jgi:hypothetical protein
MWRDDVADRSWAVLIHLRELSRFILIGGWAIYMWTRRLKSRDIDLCIDQDAFYVLQAQLQKENVPIAKNPRLRKFEARMGDVEVDIYTPFESNLIIPVKALFQNHWFAGIDQYDVALPEILLLLKSQAAVERWTSEKGLKDRIDLLSLLLYSDWKAQFLLDLARKFDPASRYLDVLLRTVKESRVEYNYLGLKYEREGRKLRGTMGRLLTRRA